MFMCLPSMGQIAVPFVIPIIIIVISAEDESVTNSRHFEHTVMIMFVSMKMTIWTSFPV